MRKLFLTLAFAVFSLWLFGQNENPYSQFGYEAPIMKSNTIEKNTPSFFLIANLDSTSLYKFVTIDTKSRILKFYSKDYEVLLIDSISVYSTARWLSPDPAGQFHSPYLGMGNNPIRAVDPDGAYTVVVPDGNGGYTVVSGVLNDDNGIYLQGAEGALGDLIGYSSTPTSFYNADVEQWMGTINPNDFSGQAYLNNEIFSNTPWIFDYTDNAKGGQYHDFKRTNGSNEVLFTEVVEYYRGMPLSSYNDMPVFGSARDVGNIAAGFIAGYHHAPWFIARWQFDKLESAQKGYKTRETAGSQYAQRLGWNIANEWRLYQTNSAIHRYPYPSPVITKSQYNPW